jgi:hypothetical protein
MGTDLFKHVAESVTYQKVTVALCMIAYGIPTDLVDDHLTMSESQSIKCVKRFAIAVVEVFGPDYLRAPNAQGTTRLLGMNKARGFPGIIGSIGCMDWR